MGLSGNGELILSDSNAYSGGTVVNAGTLVVTSAGALPDNSPLTVAAGGTFIFDPSVSAASAANGGTFAASPGAAVAAVPEPGMLVLVCAAGLVAAAEAWRRQNHQTRAAGDNASDNPNAHANRSTR